MGPFLFRGQTHYFHNLLHLVPLEWDSLLAVHLCFLAFEHGPEAEEFAEDAAEGPHVDSRGIVSRTEEKLGRAVPDCYDDLRSSPPLD